MMFAVHSYVLRLFLILGVLFTAEAATSYQLKVFAQRLSWNDAGAHCATQGMTLAYLDEAGSSFLKQQMLEDSFKNNVADDYWIGIFDTRLKDTSKNAVGYSWSSSCLSLASSWTDWKDGEPQNTVDCFCVAVYKDTAQWRSSKCDDTRPFLCSRLQENAANVYLPTKQNQCRSNQTKTVASLSSCEDLCKANQNGCCCWYSFDSASSTCTVHFGMMSDSCSTIGDQCACMTFEINKSTLSSYGLSNATPNVTCPGLTSAATVIPGQLTTDSKPTTQSSNEQLTTDNKPTTQSSDGKLTTDSKPTTQNSNGQLTTDSKPTTQSLNGQLATDNKPTTQDMNGQLTTGTKPATQSLNRQLTIESKPITHSLNGSLSGDNKSTTQSSNGPFTTDRMQITQSSTRQLVGDIKQASLESTESTQTTQIASGQLTIDGQQATQISAGQLSTDSKQKTQLSTGRLLSDRTRTTQTKRLSTESGASLNTEEALPVTLDSRSTLSDASETAQTSGESHHSTEKRWAISVTNTGNFTTQNRPAQDRMSAETQQRQFVSTSSVWSSTTKSPSWTSSMPSFFQTTFNTTQPDPSSTTHPDPSSTTQPDPSTTTQPDPPSTTHPHPSSTTQPDPSTTTQPDPSSTTHPDPSSTTQPDPLTTTQPDPSTTTTQLPSTAIHIPVKKCLQCTCLKKSSVAAHDTLTVAELQAELKVNVTLLSSSKRRKESIPDSRLSSAIIATISIMLVFSGFIGLFIFDVFRVYQDCRRRIFCRR